MAIQPEEKATIDFLKVSRDDMAESSLQGLKAYNLNEITKHNTRDDLWVIVNERVYDISNMLSKHPGGEEIILNQIKINQNLTAVFYKMNHSENALDLVKNACIGTVDKKIIGWGDLFRVKIDIIDKQHENLIGIMNDIYNNGRIEDLHKFIVAWEIHCESEEYFMDTYKFTKDMKSAHKNDHKRISKLLNDAYDDLVKKYPPSNEKNEEKNNDIINGVGNLNIENKNENDKSDVNKKNEPKCQELIDFCVSQMGGTFKKHAFHYDTLYIDKLPEIDPSASFKMEKDELFGLIRPIFPK